MTFEEYLSSLKGKTVCLLYTSASPSEDRWMAVTVSARMGAGGVHSSSVKAMAALVSSRKRWVGAGSCFCRERSWNCLFYTTGGNSILIQTPLRQDPGNGIVMGFHGDLLPDQQLSLIHI